MIIVVKESVIDTVMLTEIETETEGSGVTEKETTTEALENGSCQTETDAHTTEIEGHTESESTCGLTLNASYQI